MRLINLAALALVFVILYNVLFFHIDLGIGNGVLYLLLNSFFFITRNKNTKNLDLALASSGVAVIFAFLFSFIGNGFVQFIDLLVAVISSSIALFFYKYEPRFSLTLPNFILIPLSSALQTASNLFSIFEERNLSDSRNSELTPAVIRGGAIALVLVAILLLLLTRGDLVFGQIVNNFLSTIWERLIVSILVFISLMNFGLSKIKNRTSWLDKEVHIGIGKVHELTIILGSIIALFTLFIVIQFRYLFMPVGEMELHQIGISSSTYSEYVRAGFTELLVAATIVGGVLIYALRYIHSLPKPQKGLLQILAAVLTLENGLLLISAVKRLFLYVDAHGLTRIREFGFIFLIWLSVILVILLVGILYRLSRDIQAKLTIAITLSLLLAVNVVNLDDLIAAKYPPTVNQEIDYSYLTRLSTDAYKSWIPAINEAEKLVMQLSSKPKIETEDYRKLTYVRWSLMNLDILHTTYLEGKYGPKTTSTWQSFNLSEYFAYQHIRDNKDVFSKVTQLMETINRIEQNVTDEIRSNTRLDRSTDTPLTY